MPALSRGVLKEIRARLVDSNHGRFSEYSVHDLIALIDRALKLKRGVAAARKERATKHAASVAETRDVRELVVERAAGKCESCGTALASQWAPPGEMDHFFGGSNRKPLESVETCWLLCWMCHKQKGANKPSAEHWLIVFRAHALAYGYALAVELVDKRLERIRLRAYRHAAGGET